jgi:probable HAF family extracellular repeat protein
VLWEKDGTVVDVGNLGGRPINVATGINNRGEVVGNSSLPDGSGQPFIWTRATGIQPLGRFAGVVANAAPCCHTINDKGEVAGFSIDGTTGNVRAIVWLNKTPIDMNTLIPKGSPWYLLQALSLNNAGQIVGFGSINGNVHAFLVTSIQ